MAFLTAWLASLFPNKFTIISWLVLAGLVLAASAAGVFFYQRNLITEGKLHSAQIELNDANKKIQSQQITIDSQKRDARVQYELMTKSQNVLEAIRQKAIEDQNEISNTDFGKEANTNAKALEQAINERTKKLLENINKNSRRGKKK